MALYKELASKPYCTNSYDSAVGGAFEICGEIGEGKNIAQAIEEYKPVYQKMVDDANLSLIHISIPSSIRLPTMAIR